MVDFRNWCHNEIRINKSDLSNIATARRTFAQAEKDMLPEGVTVDEGAAHVPLQNLLEHTLTRYIVNVFKAQYLKYSKFYQHTKLC